MATSDEVASRRATNSGQRATSNGGEQQATSNGRRDGEQRQRAASNERRCNGRRAAKRRVHSGVPNKPMVPPAPSTTEERSPGSMRQHIGEPLADIEGYVLPTRDELLRKATDIPAPPVVIEAYWDGDTTGWFVVLTMLYVDGSTPNRQYREFDLSGLT